MAKHKTCDNEKLAQQTCPRCKGFGSELGDEDGCTLCNGYAWVWRCNQSGMTLAPYARTPAYW